MRNSLDIRSLPGTMVTDAVTGQGYFPVIVSLGGENLVVVHRAGAGHMGLAGRLDVIRSEDGGKTWSAPSTVADSERDDRNPALGVAPDGTLVIAYHWQGCYDAAGVWDPSLDRVDTRVVYSRDGGRTWTDDALIDYTAVNSASPFGKIHTIDGVMHMMIYTGPTFGATDATLRVGAAATPTYILRSTDAGRTWGDPTLVALGLNEADMAVLPDGAWLFAARSEQQGEQAIYACRSEDRGRFWTLLGRVTEAAEHPPDLTLLGNGWVLLTFGHRHAPYGVQGMISKDGGRTWEARRLVYDDALPGGDIGYPSTARLADGRLVTAYYTAGTKEKPLDAYAATEVACRVVRYDEKALIEAF
jgi:hypothetical protein